MDICVCFLSSLEQFSDGTMMHVLQCVRMIFVPFFYCKSLAASIERIVNVKQYLFLDSFGLLSLLQQFLCFLLFRIYIISMQTLLLHFGMKSTTHIQCNGSAYLCTEIFPSTKPLIFAFAKIENDLICTLDMRYVIRGVHLLSIFILSGITILNRKMIFMNRGSRATAHTSNHYNSQFFFVFYSPATLLPCMCLCRTAWHWLLICLFVTIYSSRMHAGFFFWCFMAKKRTDQNGIPLTWRDHLTQTIQLPAT